MRTSSLTANPYFALSSTVSPSLLHVPIANISFCQSVNISVCQSVILSLCRSLNIQCIDLPCIGLRCIDLSCPVLRGLWGGWFGRRWWRVVYGGGLRPTVGGGAPSLIMPPQPKRALIEASMCVETSAVVGGRCFFFSSLFQT